jgi:hypothetical protein
MKISTENFEELTLHLSTPFINSIFSFEKRKLKNMNIKKLNLVFYKNGIFDCVTMDLEYFGLLSYVKELYITFLVNIENLTSIIFLTNMKNLEKITLKGKYNKNFLNLIFEAFPNVEVNML